MADSPGSKPLCGVKERERRNERGRENDSTQFVKAFVALRAALYGNHWWMATLEMGRSGYDATQEVVGWGRPQGSHCCTSDSKPKQRDPFFFLWVFFINSKISMCCRQNIAVVKMLWLELGVWRMCKSERNGRNVKGRNDWQTECWVCWWGGWSVMRRSPPHSKLMFL